MSRSPTGHGFWMPARIAGDTWPDVLAATLRSERTSGLGVPRRRNLDSMRTYGSAGATSWWCLRAALRHWSLREAASSPRRGAS